LAAPIVPSSSSGRPGGPGPGQNRFNRGRRSLEPEHKINNLIRASSVRLVGENVEVGVYPLGDALRIAYEQEMDLVEISPNADPPVCRVVDYK